MEEISFIHNAHPQYIENMYQMWKANPESVDANWRAFFAGYQLGQSDNGAVATGGGQVSSTAVKEFAVINLINAYRSRGHLFTKTNPVRKRRDYKPTLALENYNLSEEDLDTVFHAGTEIGLGPATLRDIRDHLEETYCKSIGAEYMFIRIPEKAQWLMERMESTRNRPNFSIKEKKRILQKLNEAVVFEKFLHTKYVGQKRFSLQGGETLIPGIDTIIEYGSELGLEEIIIGTAHRGRLNLLANILRKRYEDIFSEFEGEAFSESAFSGDVKYHLGYSSDIKTENGKTVRVNLAPNPSHLEAVNPVVAGMVKSKLDHVYHGDEDKIAPVIIHGDAAIAGQGVAYELIQMSLLDGYRTGGSIHIVVNNQIGFTTNYLQARSSTYCTDVAKVTLSPVFHVNADDAEAVVLTLRMALEYRQKFHTDVFIDLLGYRRYGHNEGDEPRFTQPKLYSVIANHPDPREIYVKQLRESGKLEGNLAKQLEKEFKKTLQEKLEMVRTQHLDELEHPPDFVEPCDLKQREHHHRFDPVPNTHFPKDKLIALGKRVFTLPVDKDFNFFNKVRKLYEDRLNRLLNTNALDWGSAEFLAYGTLAYEGHSVRLSGQDSERGTFSHRHAVLRDEMTEEFYLPLNHISENQAQCRVFNSLLSEYGEMGFEYGYSCATPHGLNIWEAQFGDFANGAQIMVDQFLSSSEAKWQRTNGLVLYLPHGYEGQGPEHSNARIERFLQLSANENWRVCVPSTPASFYHLLRTQVKYPFRAPLIVFTPKVLLRHPQCVSTVEELAEGAFRPVLDDPVADPAKVKRLLLCSGKIYYELDERRRKEKRDDLAIIRFEQLYPFPDNDLDAIKKLYKKAKEIFWVQEEPENYGAWPFYRVWLGTGIPGITRKASSAPATGFHKQHAIEQKEILDKAFA
ncbi:MAG: 2-oxoglutarate dehydrogenase E1 component [Calditrichaeota bacterium]|nr:MAG: 2-oxoglutarate dehydrogenase E1 component [Calditrichota bacterium]